MGIKVAVTLVLLLLMIICRSQREREGVRALAWRELGVALIFAALCFGCRGGTASSAQHGTPAGTYQVTVNGSSGNSSHDIVLNLTVQ